MHRDAVFPEAWFEASGPQSHPDTKVDANWESTTTIPSVTSLSRGEQDALRPAETTGSEEDTAPNTEEDRNAAADRLRRNSFDFVCNMAEAAGTAPGTDANVPSLTLPSKAYTVCQGNVVRQ